MVGVRLLLSCGMLLCECAVQGLVLVSARGFAVENFIILVVLL